MDLTQPEFELLKEIAERVTFDPAGANGLRVREVYGVAVLDDALRRLTEAGLISTSTEGYRLTRAGHDVALESASEFQIEEERDTLPLVRDDEPHGPPRKPFDATLIRMERAGYSVFETVRRIGSNRIRLNPDFQRAFVWDRKRQSQLIESLLMRIPLPAIYVDASREDGWEVIDGLQRLSTLRDYLNPSGGFPLTELAFLKELTGCRFFELPSAYKTIIEDAQLTFFCLQPGVEPSAKYIIFSRLNTGGMPLVAQEIRHALFQGPITKVLRELTLHTDFLLATQRGFKSERMQDREIVLRALGFARLRYSDEGLVEYILYDDLEDFLNASMEFFNRPENLPILNKLAGEFLRAMSGARVLFGRYAFRKFYTVHGRRGALNKALFEAWTVALMFKDTKALAPKKDFLQERFADLLSTDEDFEKSVTSSTGSFSAVLQRFEAVEHLVLEALA